MKPTLPMLPCWRIGGVDDRGGLLPIESSKAVTYSAGAAWCDRCRLWHFHGYAAGSRMPHCEAGAGHSDQVFGYALDLKGDAPPELRADMRRRRPLGPDLVLRSKAR